ncbi:adenylyl-sulfate kinase [Brevundimonas sp.]|uniref:adenylyl-sulfate kinase n=1 Tax=Brevundimonas sp. TaxID=1871086 RepID=UPI002489B74E|nr:adenylyl-sulfate kinase [Brevundimonas sp.]MDI1281833.1 adenylyl-sulfate kinase [Brevundimonas sp.]
MTGSRAPACDVLVRLVTCGSVDDGKSTLIGRLLYDAGAVPEDQLLALGDDPDLSRLVDGLSAEREQGITIDVAYRYFDLGDRRFILADAPGHEQYTRNMVTAASGADVAVVLIDARNGILTQTRRHSRLLALMGVRRLVLAVNKMDLVDWSPDRFDEIRADFRGFAAELGLDDVTAIPISARHGVNIATRSDQAAWYQGPTLMDWLRAIRLDAAATGPLRMMVQGTIRPHADFRGAAGWIADGEVRPGQAVHILPSGVAATVDRIVTRDGDLETAGRHQAVTLALIPDVDVSRGDLIVAADRQPGVADQFEAHLVWMSYRPLLPGRSYWLKLGTTTLPAQVSDIRHRINVDTGEHQAARTLELNDIGYCVVAVTTPIAFEPYMTSRSLGGFILIDRMTEETVGAGMITRALHRSANVRPQALHVSRDQRAALKRQKPMVLWFTGLSGAGKSTIANRVEQALLDQGLHTVLLDGDNLRHGLNRDLGFTDADRVENIRRVTEVARLMTEAGLIVLVSFISPFRAERQMARERMAPGEFIEIFVDVPLAVAEQRDTKGLYAKARAGQLPHFTGIDSPYEAPESPDLHIDTTTCSPEAASSRILALVQSRQDG